MENQKKVELISFELTDYRIIKAVKLDFDKWKDTNVLEVVGDMGNGKSSLLEGLSMATTGIGHIKDKDLLDLGFKSEVLLSDGEHKIYLGVKVVEITKGKNKGEPKFETYLYEKDLDGKLISNPVIDGRKATAKEYTDLLSTALTFRMAEMFSENQTVHRNLIQELFARELSELHVDELLESIAQKKKDRDDVRFDCERNSAFKEHFKTEGYSEASLEALKEIPTEKLEAELETLKVDKGMLLKNSEIIKEKKLSEIEKEGREVVEDIRKLNEKRAKEYNDWKVLADVYGLDNKHLVDFKQAFSESIIPSNIHSEIKSSVVKWEDQINETHKSFVESEVKEKPITLEITDGRVMIYEDTVIPKDYEALMKKKSKIGLRYKAEKEKEIDPTEIDTKEIDAKITAKEVEIKTANDNNDLFNRYQMWLDWIEKKGIYEKEVDTLRKLYTKIDTEVDGLYIQPSLTDGGKLEIFMEYGGDHHPELFKNPKKELRRLYEYSKSQRAIIGVLLQAARLDKKDKALRLAVLDDYTQTKKGKSLLEKICKERDLKLVISKTSDEYDLKQLGDGCFAIENGELLLG